MGLDPNTLPDSFKRLMPQADRKALGVAGMTFGEAQAKKATRDEKELQDQIEAFFRIRDIIANRSRMDKPKTDMVGWPDFTFAVKGKAAAVEVKMPGEEPTPEQWRVMCAMVKNGWRVAIVRSVAEVKALIDELES